jgi:alkylation response protein AidB-like acyl-CoA dehydrogenase
MDLELSAADEAVRDEVRAFAEGVLAPAARAADEAARFDRTLLPRLAGAGVLGGPLDPRWGGRGWSHLQWALASAELGAADSSWRGFATVQTSLCGQLLQDFGDEKQKRERLPALCRGEEIFAYALTEPEAGSDVVSLRCEARPEGEGWRLHGTKHWITNGGVADWILLFATVDPDQRKRGITCFLIRGDAPGLRRERVAGEHLGHRAADHAVLHLAGVRVGPEDVVGEVGRGFEVAMGGLGYGRLSVAAGAVGILSACERLCLERAGVRRQFGRRIGDFQLVQALLTDVHLARTSSELLTWRAAWLRDAGKPHAAAVSLAKFAASEAALRAADQAILLFGAEGYSSEVPAGRLWRDAKGMQIYEGTAHVQRLIIARDLLGRETS